ncbi:MAG: preprotein translocase subunit YajC [Rhizobiales bacterium]|nr:preprotein translocase subunit YajC [Hyphomicrobiales bacterium]
MFISQAFAQGAGSPDGGGILFQLIPFILIFVVIYFLILRPQQKRAKEHKEMVAALRRGDQVLTNGGLLGKISKVTDDAEDVEVEIAKGVKVRVMRHMISEVRSRTEPVASK